MGVEQASKFVKRKAVIITRFRYRKSSIKPPGGLIFFQAVLRGGGLIEREGLKERGGLFNLAKRITCSKNTVVVTVKSIYFTCGSPQVTKTKFLFFKNVLRRELERKVEKVKHMKLVVMRPKTKNNMNFQPE